MGVVTHSAQIAAPASQRPAPSTLSPLLTCLLLETLRLYATVPGQLRRITPFTPTGITIEGYSHIPDGVTVSANAHSLRRNKAVFPEPERWKPEKWDTDEKRREEMKRWFLAFGSGGEDVLGKSLYGSRSASFLCPFLVFTFRLEVALLDRFLVAAGDANGGYECSNEIGYRGHLYGLHD